MNAKKTKAAKPAWKESSGLSRNQVLDFGSFAISYVPPGNMAAFSIFNSEDSCAETALFKDGKYYILNGDWRKDYEKLGPKGFAACLKFFKANEKHKSSWSN